MKITLGNNVYEILENIDNCFDLELLKSMYTEYFYDYDYLLGDYAYNKLRLKGFCDKGNKIFNSINDYKTIDNYIKNDCAYDCKYFIIKKNQVCCLQHTFCIQKNTFIGVFS